VGTRQTCTRSEEGSVEPVLLIVADVVLGDGAAGTTLCTCASCPAGLGTGRGVTGAAIRSIEYVLSTAAVDRTLQAAAA